MAETEKKRVKLPGGPPHTASSAEIQEDGSLVVEFYDFSDMAQDTFGNDVAFLLTVAAADKPRILSEMKQAGVEMEAHTDRDALLLQQLQEQFKHYYEVKEWLDRCGIPYETAFDSWA